MGQTNTMELRHLRYFVTLAEELHVTRAAERLGISQPPLSIQIKQIEAEIGAPLFYRRSRGLELTDLGKTFLADAERVLAQMDRAIADAQSRAQGHTGSLRIGFGGATYLPAEVPAAILLYRERFPQVSLTPLQSNTPALVRALQDNELDVAFIRPPYELGATVCTETFLVEDMLAVLPAGHLLARNRTLHLKDLAAENFILFPRKVGPGLHDSIITACSEAGFAALIGQEASQIVSAVPMVAAGFGVSIVPRSVAAMEVPGVCYCTLADTTLSAPISFAWRADDCLPALDSFLKILRSGASSSGASGARSIPRTNPRNCNYRGC